MSRDTSPGWKELTKFIADEIGKHWVNEYYEEAYTIFITKRSLTQIWSDEDAFEEGSAFTVFKRLFEQDRLERKKFEQNSILLVSALLYYKWKPDATDRPCLPHNDGLMFTKTNELFTDDDLTLSSEQIRSIFGNANVDFSEGQYRFCPAVLHDKNGNGFIRLSREKRLPFEFMQNEKKRHGWYGEVSRIKIKSGYLVTYPQASVDKGSEFACKTILHSRQDFHTEVRNLETIRHNALSHGHIVTHLVAVHVPPNKFKIVFPWAFTDLADLLRKPHPKLPKWLSPSKFNAWNAVKEVTLLAGALDFLHRRISSSADNQPIALYHMDLKPDNVLVFKPQGPQEENDHPMGFWKITDFGLSDTKKVHVGDLIDSLEAGDRSSDQPLQRRSGPYQAPEIERKHEFGDHVIDHAKADMWSYGAVVAEVLAFCIAGRDSVQEMRKALQHDEDDEDNVSRDMHFYHFTKGEYRLCPELLEFFEQDSENDSEQSSPWHQRVWDSVKQFALQVNPAERYTAKQMSKELTRHFDGAPYIQLVQDDGIETFEDENSLNERSMSAEYTPTDQEDSVHIASREASLTSESSDGEEKFSEDPPTPDRVERSQTYDPKGGDAPDSQQSQNSATELDLGETLRPTRSSPARCEQMTTKSKSFTEHLSRQHLKSDKVDFVVTNWNGTEAIFSHGRQLTQAYLPESGSIKCAGAVPRTTKGKLETYAVGISSSLVIVRESSLLHVHQFGGDGGYLDTESLQEKIGGKHVKSFQLSANDRICLLHNDSISVLDLHNGDTLLQGEKAAIDGDFASASFDPAGENLYAVSNDKYVVWRFHESDKRFVKEVEVKHNLISDLQSSSLRLITTNLSMTCLAQLRTRPKTVYFLGKSVQSSLRLEHDKFLISSRLCAFSQKAQAFLLCIGHRKPHKFSAPKHVLLIWPLSVSSNGKPIIGEPRHQELNAKLHSDASMGTGLCVRSGDEPLAIIVEESGHVQSVALK